MYNFSVPFSLIYRECLICKFNKQGIGPQENYVDDDVKISLLNELKKFSLII